ncbi:MAG: hypothetical protein DMG08_26375 [Acidobacteria bacterium]|nr:MAG: hypothetical protein DMG08_26375 [Acidobacteriota bacterium]
MLEIARQIRPRLYDIFCEKPKPLIPRYLCYGVPERIDYAGQVVRPLDEDAVREVVRAIRKENVEAVAVCLLHSYVNPAHERRVGAVIAEELPAVFVSLSSELCPEMREYFRASTTVINAVEMPIVSRYLDLLENRLSGIGVETGLNLMASAGGIISSQVARREPVHLVESGPAAARSPGSTRPVYSRSGRAAPGRTPGRPATDAAATSRRSPTRTCSWDASTRDTSWAANFRSILSWRRRP